MKITFRNITHIIYTCIKFLIGLIFVVIFTLVLVDVEFYESENRNFLKYGRIGKHPVQSLYTRYYLTL